MRLKTVINIFITFSLIILGALLGDGYKDRLYLLWLLSLILYALIIEYLLNKNSDLEVTITEAEGKVSALTITKNTHQNDGVLQASFFPKSVEEPIYSNEVFTIELYLTSIIELNRVPDLKLITENEWKVYNGQQEISFINYAERFEYNIGQPVILNRENKYIKYSFDVEISTPGVQKFYILFNNGEFNCELNNDLFIRPS